MAKLHLPEGGFTALRGQQRSNSIDRMKDAGSLICAEGVREISGLVPLGKQAQEKAAHFRVNPDDANVAGREDENIVEIVQLLPIEAGEVSPKNSAKGMAGAATQRSE